MSASFLLEERMSVSRVLLAVALSLLLTQCNDPPFDNGDAGPDATSNTDNPNPATDNCTIHGWNCLQIGDCAKTCGTDQACVDSCASEGCDLAKTAFDDNKGCIIPNCWSSCTSGFSEDCLKCASEKCPDTMKTCTDNQCPVDCTNPPDGGSEENTPADGDGSAKPLGCSDLYSCIRDCLVETDWCIDDCKALGCTQSGQDLENLFDCAKANCDFFDCFRYTSDECLGCMKQQCADLWSTCGKNSC
jgi:hypothetical protein